MGLLYLYFFVVVLVSESTREDSVKIEDNGPVTL
jgi:hypothetical protein